MSEPYSIFIQLHLNFIQFLLARRSYSYLISKILAYNENVERCVGKNLSFYKIAYKCYEINCEYVRIIFIIYNFTM